jgi:hypothetical protein
VIRVYRRPPGDRRGFSDDRPWNVAGIPEDMGRESCYATWADAMAWALTPPEERARVIDQELKMEGTW